MKVYTASVLLLASAVPSFTHARIQGGGTQEDEALPPAQESRDLTSLGCGCNSCDQAQWDTLSGDKPSEWPCGGRISYLRDYEGYSEIDACRRVAAFEFPGVCGGCNPDTCDGRQLSDQQWTPPTFISDPYVAPTPPITDSDWLYCFPPIGSRVRHENVWRKRGRHRHPGYIVDVKEGPLCGPGANRFASNTVSTNGRSLTMEFAYSTATGVWEASEVRILQANQEAYGYGRYEFTISSTEVIDVNTGAVVDDKLPETLVLGLFTWDSTDDYASHQNWNHEVDVEVSRWDTPNHRDAQFLVQPPLQGLKSRFYTGITPNTYDQNSLTTYSFDWEPAHITWASSAGHSFEISTEYSLFYQALGYSLPDHIQCLPANVEVRINLWNTLGVNPPTNLSPDQKVRVVIDKFSYVPSGETHVADGGYCSKHCHCDVTSSQCVNGICTSV